jgi:hypothetical protein
MQRLHVLPGLVTLLVACHAHSPKRKTELDCARPRGLTALVAVRATPGRPDTMSVLQVVVRSADFPERGLPGARAFLVGPHGRTAVVPYTPDDGSATFPSTAAGQYQLEVRRIGFTAGRWPITLRRGTRHEARVTLARDGVCLAPQVPVGETAAK